MIEEVIQKEWEFFQQIHHIDGIADCMQDERTFHIMRSSQFMTWSHDLVASYFHDLQEYQKHNINPIYLKYGYMMKSNDPDAYKQIEDTLLVVPPDKQDIIEEIIKIQLQWKEEFNQRYPILASSSRTIYSIDDTKEDTSFETYLRGELSTYLDKTLFLYGKMIIEYVHQNKNITTLIMENTAAYYQYDCLDDIKETL